LQLGRCGGECCGAQAEREESSEKSRGTHGSMSFPFFVLLEGRRLRRSSGNPAANRVDSGSGERTADERHLHALARREASVDLQEEEAVVGVAGDDAVQVRRLGGYVG